MSHSWRPDGEEVVKIVDFGIAQLRTNEEAAAGASKRRLTRTGMIFGTPEYMSPEQAAGKHADHRSDVYAVAIILYEMFTGAVPFTGETFLEVLNKHLNGTMPPMPAVFPELQISPDLQAVIAHGLEKAPESRFQSMNEFAHALLTTPEGSGLTRSSLIPGPMTDASGYGYLPPGSPTAAQFHKPSTLGPAVQQGTPSVRSTTPIELSVRSAETQAATANTVLGQRNSGVGIALAMGGVLLVFVAGAGAFFALRGKPAEAEALPPPSAPHPVTAPSHWAAPDPTSVVAPPTTASAAPSVSAAITVESSVRLDVVTEPAGATLFKNGFQVCDATPCEVTADPNETLSLEARKGAQKGAAKVLAQRDQKVTIKLAGGGGARPPSGPRMCEVEVDGLKILRPCP